jgi:hypothetical protein
MTDRSNPSCPLARRDLLKLAAAGAGLLFLPSIASVARADRRAGAAKRVLVLNLSGGVRSSAAFLASQQKKYNPFGLIENAGTRAPLGKLLDDHPTGGTPLADADYTLGPAWGGERVPRFRETARELAVLGTWDPERGDHLRSRVLEPTGSSAGDRAGILTRIAAGLGERATEVLPFHLAPAAAFGQAANLARYAPISLASPQSLPAESAAGAAEGQATGNDWARDDAMRERLDRGVIAKRARNGKALAEVFSIHRRGSRQIGRRLAEKWVNVGKADAEYRDAAFGAVKIGGVDKPLTNAMLHELFAMTLGGRAAEANVHYPAALNAALAIRLLQLGSPAVSLEIDGFDLHSDERKDAPPLYRFLGRLWATLGWLMKRVPDPQAPGRSLFDTTLVVTMSDFGRDPGSTSTGYNGGEGSDHGTDASCYYLAHAAMGGGVRGDRIVGEVSTDDYRGDSAPVRFRSQDLLAMTLWALGLDHENPIWGFEGVTAPIDALFRA